MKKKYIVIGTILILFVLFFLFHYLENVSPNIGIRPTSTRYTYEVLLEPQYDKITFFYEEGAITFSQNNKHGCFFVGKGEIIPAMYSHLAYHPLDELFTASIGTTFGAVDINNQIIIPFEYDDIYYLGYRNGKVLFKVKKNSELYYIDDQNKKVEDEINEADFVKIKRNPKSWFLERTVYKKQEFFINSLVEDDTIIRYGVTDSDGRQIIPCEYLQFQADLYVEKILFVTDLKNKQGVIRIVPLEK